MWIFHDAILAKFALSLQVRYGIQVPGDDNRLWPFSYLGNRRKMAELCKGLLLPSNAQNVPANVACRLKSEFV